MIELVKTCIEILYRVLLVWFLLLGIIYMPILTGIPAITFWIPLSDGNMSITLGITAMWSTKTLLEAGIIPLETIVFYGVVPAIAMLHIIYDTYKRFIGG